MPGSLSHAPSVVVQNLLIALGIGTRQSADGAWPVYATQEPTKPDEVITIYDTEGRTGNRDAPTKERPEYNGIQIRVRGQNYADGHTKAEAIAIALDSSVFKTAVSVPDASGTGSTSYMVWMMRRISGPLALGKESPTSRRDLFTINAEVSLRQSS